MYIKLRSGQNIDNFQNISQYTYFIKDELLISNSNYVNSLIEWVCNTRLPSSTTWSKMVIFSKKKYQGHKVIAWPWYHLIFFKVQYACQILSFFLLCFKRYSQCYRFGHKWIFKCVSFWLHGCCGELEGGPVIQVNHTSWVAVVTPTDRPKSVRNCCLIEVFCGVVCVVTLPFWHFCWCRGFCHRTGSDLLLFVLTYTWLFLRVKVTIARSYGHWPWYH